MGIERTLVIIKPDGVQRGLVGTILGTLEAAGLRIQQLQIVAPSRRQVLDHYTDDAAWKETVGRSAIATLEAAEIDWRSLTGADSSQEIGQLIRTQLGDYLCSGPIAVARIEGNDAVRKVRQIVGATVPTNADAETIRGEYSSDDAVNSFTEARALRNIIHASSSVYEAMREIEIWFGSRAGIGDQGRYRAP